MWNPVINFENLKKYQPTKIYGHDEKFVFYYKSDHSLTYREGCQLTFTCHFDLQTFPFDSNECRIEYGDFFYGTNSMNFKSATILYQDKKTRYGIDPPILIADLPYPFEFELQSIPTFNKTIEGYNHSYTGMLLKMKRKSFRKLISGFYYPTGSFAMLSMISFLIKPDVVSIFTYKMKVNQGSIVDSDFVILPLGSR